MCASKYIQGFQHVHEVFPVRDVWKVVRKKETERELKKKKSECSKSERKRGGETFFF